MIRHATQKQINYARVIATELGLKEPKPIFEECYSFICDHVDEYRNNLVLKEKMKDVGSDIKAELFADTYGETTIEWMQANLWKKAGVYAFLAEDGSLLYIGKSKDLGTRIISSYEERSRKATIGRVLYYITPTEADASILEMYLIAECDPLLNSDGKTDDKPQMFRADIDIERDFAELFAQEE